MRKQFPDLELKNLTGKMKEINELKRRIESHNLENASEKSSRE